MATPLGAGCRAIHRESLFKNGYKDEAGTGKKNPTSSLVKALLINGASPIKGQYMPDDIGDEPIPHSGFGRINMSDSICKPGNTFSGYLIGVVTEAEEKPVGFEVPIPTRAEALNGSHPASTAGPLSFKVTMVYADQPGSALINDLNLVVKIGDKERHGNQVNSVFPVDTADGFDRTNNVEQIVWPDVGEASVARVMVRPYRLLADVPFACAWRFIV